MHKTKPHKRAVHCIINIGLHTKYVNPDQKLHIQQNKYLVLILKHNLVIIGFIIIRTQTESS